jgi:hypothetical protein
MHQNSDASLKIFTRASRANLFDFAGYTRPKN